MEPGQLPPDNRPEWLRALAEKSWNLELVISGAAIFLASYLPDAVDAMLRYYLENLVMDEDFSKITLPLMAYSFMKVVAWLLIITFVVHFIMRAFWAGVVGLHTVYTEGIRYEQMPWQTDFTKEQMRRRFGPLSDYILRLDRLCNQVFSVAFLIALMSIGIGIAYMAIFLTVNVLPAVLGKTAGKIGSLILLGIVTIIAVLPAMAMLAVRSPRLANHPIVQRLATWAVRHSGNMLMPFVYRPMSYINMTFTSNVSKTRLLLTVFGGSLIIMAGVILNFTSVMFHLSGRNTFTTRDFYSEGRNIHLLTGGCYDNMRSPLERLPPVSISSEITEGPFLRVFVDYPKLLDAALLQRCTTPVLPDSMPRSMRRAITDSTHLACMTDFFRLRINDSLIAQPGWMFHEHPVVGSPGLVAYLPTAHLKIGKNVLLVQVPASKNPDSLRVYGEVPFWYAPR